MDTMHSWQPIETYDSLKKKPKHAVFLFGGTAPARGQAGKYGLYPMIELSRFCGSRVCIGWYPLPDIPKDLPIPD